MSRLWIKNRHDHRIKDQVFSLSNIVGLFVVKSPKMFKHFAYVYKLIAFTAVFLENMAQIVLFAQLQQHLIVFLMHFYQRNCIVAFLCTMKECITFSSSNYKY
jgi:hypothetical protein